MERSDGGDRARMTQSALLNDVMAVLLRQPRFVPARRRIGAWMAGATLGWANLGKCDGLRSLNARVNGGVVDVSMDVGRIHLGSNGSSFSILAPEVLPLTIAEGAGGLTLDTLVALDLVGINAPLPPIRKVVVDQPAGSTLVRIESELIEFAFG